MLLGVMIITKETPLLELLLDASSLCSPRLLYSAPLSSVCRCFVEIFISANCPRVSPTAGISKHDMILSTCEVCFPELTPWQRSGCTGLSRIDDLDWE